MLLQFELTLLNRPFNLVYVGVALSESLRSCMFWVKSYEVFLPMVPMKKLISLVLISYLMC